MRKLIISITVANASVISQSWANSDGLSGNDLFIGKERSRSPMSEDQSGDWYPCCYVVGVMVTNACGVRNIRQSLAQRSPRAFWCLRAAAEWALRPVGDASLTSLQLGLGLLAGRDCKSQGNFDR